MGYTDRLVDNSAIAERAGRAAAQRPVAGGYAYHVQERMLAAEKRQAQVTADSEREAELEQARLREGEARADRALDFVFEKAAERAQALSTALDGEPEWTDADDDLTDVFVRGRQESGRTADDVLDELLERERLLEHVSADEYAAAQEAGDPEVSGAENVIAYRASPEVVEAQREVESDQHKASLEARGRERADAAERHAALDADPVEFGDAERAKRSLARLAGLE